MKINTINSIETSSICDNKCEYCPSPLQGKYRETGFMDMRTFTRALEWVSACVRAGTQKELNLFGVGEPTLNKNIIKMVEDARLALPMSQAVHLNTNGNSMTEDLALSLKNAGINHIHITGHNARAAARCIKIFKKVGLAGGMSFDYITAPNNWAGQVDWFEADYTFECQWLRDGQVMIMSNGDVTTCCIDAFATNVVGNIFTHRMEDIDLQPHKLCETCHHTVVEEKRIITV
jgi:MoaA/NifB/PqqE/SkfB family radical SAM enzyme